MSFSLKKLSKRIGSSFAVATGNGGLSERPSSLADRRKMDLLSFSIKENFEEISIEISIGGCSLSLYGDSLSCSREFRREWFSMARSTKPE